MLNFCLKKEEKNLLKSLIGKKLIKYRHDSLDKFGGDTVYSRVEFFLDDTIILIGYDYGPYPLFGNNNDDHPKFFIKTISEDNAVSALQNTNQIDVECEEIITSITLVEDGMIVEWDGKKDSVCVLKAIVFNFGNKKLILQGDYMIPLIDVLKGKNAQEQLLPPGDEFSNNPDIKYNAERFYVEL